MTLLQAIMLGILQGLTEFLPVSSSGHLAIAQSFLPGFSQPGLLFDVMLHAGTMVAVILYFRREVFLLLSSPFRSDDEARLYRRLLTLILIGSVPTAIMGVAFEDFFKGLFHNMTVVASMLLVTGTLLVLSERFRRKGRKEGELTLSDAIVVGTVQGCAIIPGISRSGSTIAALLLKGVDGETAARFSFLLALPAVFGAAFFSLKDVHAIATEAIPCYLAGTAVSFFTGLLAIHFLMAVIRKKRLYAFSIYCWVAGGLLLTFAI